MTSRQEVMAAKVRATARRPYLFTWMFLAEWTSAFNPLLTADGARQLDAGRLTLANTRVEMLRAGGEFRPARVC